MKPYIKTLMLSGVLAGMAACTDPKKAYEELNLTFLFAQRFHSAMRFAAPARGLTTTLSCK